MAAPAWMTSDLFKSVLIHHYKEKSLIILDFKCTPVVPAGDNYTSDLYRASVTHKCGKSGNKETISLIVKSTPSGEIMEEFIKSVNLFEKEIHMFSRILPGIYNILGESACLSPECYYVHTDGPRSILVLEDLKPLNFTMHDRRIGLDLDHCLMVMEKIARFHAASVVYLKDNIDALPEPFNHGLYKSVDAVKDWLEMSFKSAWENALNWSECRIYAEKMRRMNDVIFDKATDISSRHDDFGVLNHGDMWVNNIMFAYDNNGKVKDMKFVDFQVCIYSSPAIDLHYFLATSPKNEVRRNYQSYLLDYYYAQFLAQLTKLKYSLENVPSREEFIKDFNRRALYGLVATVTVTPIIKAEKRKDASFEELMTNADEGGFRHHCFSNEAFKAILQEQLPYYDSLGVLD